ncbi:pectinesterase 35 [Dorcoceras hygrometricum]|uniref:Pectinesterase 35 n=1 Tax=Dorcoceras hygrometricum TaxID=472368 RepID=A0A2Z7B8V3_9LAMI|nr:pectinesterase 35 [Dorcoceras hygrometricum]
MEISACLELSSFGFSRVCASWTQLRDVMVTLSRSGWNISWISSGVCDDLGTVDHIGSVSDPSWLYATLSTRAGQLSIVLDTRSVSPELVQRGLRSRTSLELEGGRTEIIDEDMPLWILSVDHRLLGYSFELLVPPVTMHCILLCHCYLLAVYVLSVLGFDHCPSGAVWLFVCHAGFPGSSAGHGGDSAGGAP